MIGSRRSVIDCDHCSGQRRRRILALHPIGVSDRSQVLMNHRLVGPTTRETALSQSLPMPRTQESLRVVTREAVGAPLVALPEAVAPIAPEPFVPVVSTPLTLMVVIELAAALDNVAVTTELVRGLAAKARQISAVPGCVLVRFTKDQVNPAPDMLFT